MVFVMFVWIDRHAHFVFFSIRTYFPAVYFGHKNFMNYSPEQLSHKSMPAIKLPAVMRYLYIIIRSVTTKYYGLWRTGHKMILHIKERSASGQFHGSWYLSLVTPTHSPFYYTWRGYWKGRWIQSFKRINAIQNERNRQKKVSLKDAKIYFEFLFYSRLSLSDIATTILRGLPTDYCVFSEWLSWIFYVFTFSLGEKERSQFEWIRLHAKQLLVETSRAW